MARHGKKKQATQKPPSKSGGGMMMGMRGGMKRVARSVKGGKPAGAGKAGPWGRALDIALWAAVIAMALYWILKR